MRILGIIAFLMFVAGNSETYAQSQVCPLYKICAYGSMDMWYAQYCPVTGFPQFTTMVLPAGMNPASTGCGSPACINNTIALAAEKKHVTHLLQPGMKNRFHEFLHKNGYKKDYANGSPHPWITESTDVTPATGVNVQVEKWTVTYRDKPNGTGSVPRFARIVRIKVQQSQVVGVMAAEIQPVTTAEEATLLDHSANNKHFSRILFELSDTESIVTNVLHYE